MNFTEQLEGFVSDLNTKGRSVFTITAYKKDISQFIEYLERKKISNWSKVNTKTIQEYINEKSNSGEYSNKTISRKINSLKTFFKFLISEKLIFEDYAKPINHPKLEKQLPRILSPLEYKALRDTARVNIRLYAIIETLLQTGIRIGELSRLKTSQVDLKQELITVEGFSSYPERLVPINSTLKMTLLEYKNKQKSSSDYFFCAKSGKMLLIRNIRSSIDKAFKKTGIKDAKVNDIRNTFILHQLENGMKIEKLAEVVGHKKVISTQVYLDFLVSRPRKTTLKITPL